MTINTKQAERRTLCFETTKDLSAELDRLDEMERAGGLRSTGNYTPAQNLNHMASWIERYENNDMPEVPWYIRPVGRLMRKRILTKGFPAGLPGPGNKPQPEPDVDFAPAMARMREKVGVLETQDLSHKNPFLGKISKQDAIELHLRHAELHLGFIHPASSS